MSDEEGQDVAAPKQQGRGQEPQKAIIAVCIPAMDQVSATFALDLARMAAWTGTAGVASGAVDMTINMVMHHSVVHARNELAQMAVASKATHILWLDSDMRFPRQTIARLLTHQVPVVGVNYLTRKAPFRATAVSDETLAQTCRTRKGDERIEPVDTLGFGVVLMQTDVLRALPKPWFAAGTNDDGKWVSEDTFFCRRMRDELNIRPVVDHELSQLVRHSGMFEFNVTFDEAKIVEA